MNNYISISKDDLYFNIDTIKKFTGTPIIAVVKCNGYGLGLDTAVKAWRENGVDFFAVSEPKEALYIKKNGCEDADVLLLAPTWDTDTLTKLDDAGVIMTVTSREHAELVASACPQARIHVKINVGMGRFGLKYTEYDEISNIYKVNNLQFEGIFAHFPQAFADNDRITKRQLKYFTQVTDKLAENGIQIGIRHIANSCGALKFKEARLDAVRIGSAITGRLPGRVPVKLRPLGTFKAQVADVSELDAGDTTGYSMICKISKPTQTAIVTAGYTDGWGMRRYIPALSRTDVLRNMYHALKEGVTRETVTWQGKKLKVLGRIGTQYTVIDITGSELVPGDWVDIKSNIMFADSSIPRLLEY